MQLAELRKDLQSIVGASNASDSFYAISKSCEEEVSRKVFGLGKSVPFVVARPKSVEQVQKILKYANEKRVSVFVRGSGTGYFGGDVARKFGIVLETTGLSKIIELDRDGGFVSCETGITVEALNKFLEKHRLWWPHNPGSRRWATVGGSLASLGVGTFTARYGYASDTLTGMSIVLPSGELVKLGSKTRHDMASYNAHDLFTSAEGTLGVIVQATLKVFPVPQGRSVQLFLFKTLRDTVNACLDLVYSGIYSESIEIEDKERFTLEGLAPVIDLNDARVKRLKLQVVEAALLVVLTGSDSLREFQSREAARIASQRGGNEIRDKKILDLYWKGKTKISSFKAKGKSSGSKVHTCVPAIPFNKVPEFEQEYLRLGARFSKLSLVGVGYYITLPSFECTASARVLFDELDVLSLREYERFARELAEEVVRIGGTPASTFGVGTILVDIIREFLPESQIELSKRLKKMFDPRRILSPGKKI